LQLSQNSAKHSRLTQWASFCRGVKPCLTRRPPSPAVGGLVFSTCPVRGVFSVLTLVPFSMHPLKWQLVPSVKTGGFTGVFMGVSTGETAARGVGVGPTLRSIISPPIRAHRCRTLPVTSTGWSSVARPSPTKVRCPRRPVVLLIVRNVRAPRASRRAFERAIVR